MEANVSLAYSHQNADGPVMSQFNTISTLTAYLSNNRINFGFDHPSVPSTLSTSFTFIDKMFTHSCHFACEIYVLSFRSPWINLTNNMRRKLKIMKVTIYNIILWKLYNKVWINNYKTVNCFCKTKLIIFSLIHLKIIK